MVWLATVTMLALAGAAPLAESPDAALPAPAIIVDPDAFRCLLANVARIPDEPRGVFVDFRDCTRDGIRIIRHLYAPTPPRDPSGKEYVLFIRPPQLACLKRHRKNAASLLEALPGNRQRLRLTPCAR